ncbi:helix-turn-helix domain-containing protein [Lactobacillus sp. 3B(2020)]|uniref:helix-turn-helix domain-containing protein n=1 Tax=Lactobacillus sp. 3B(2020) TaxID=2695882 RepID=UPI0015DDFB74|nr:helix-turn-helix transcriptional regulator [Lactobacillus sp. 3B(2020)]QLL70252.1 helix-turn-helix domain-containing protein [Lactobacillus sp. 3B(2020)]
MLWLSVENELTRQGKSVYWLGKQTGIPTNTLYQYKNDGVEPTFSKVCKIADALGVSLDELRDKKGSS